MRKITVIIPVYNVEKYVEQCLDSVVNQSMFKELEIICINDASTDKSLEILNNYSKKYENFKIIDLKENKGVSIARNIGIENSTCEYVAFLDSDDFIDREMYQKMYEKILKEKSDVVECNYSIYKDNKKEKIKKFYDKENYLKTEINDWKEYLLISTHGGTKLIKKDLIIKNNLKFPENLYYEDNYFFFILKLLSNKVSIINEIYYNYRRENENSTTLKKDNYRFFDRLETSKMLINKAQRLNQKLYNNKITEEIEYRFFELYYKNTLVHLVNPKAFSKVDLSKYNEIKREIKKIMPNYKENKYYLEWWQTLSLKLKIRYILSENFPKLMFNILRVIY